MATSRQVARVLRDNLRGYAFVGLALFGMLAFRLAPMIQSLYYSFTRYDVLTPPRWVGVENYARIFATDELFWKSLVNTAYYVGVSVPLRLVIALFLAILLNQKVRGMSVFRTLFYLPTVTAMIAVATLWQWAFEPAFGIINNALKVFGIKGPAWLGDPAWAMPAIIIVACWQVGQQMLIFLAGLQSVPVQLYEVAELDGTPWWRRFLGVTLPLLSPIVFFNMVVGVIQSFQVFAKIYIMTGGGPVNSTEVYVMYLYRRAFTYLEMGYGSALAWILLVIILGLTLVQMAASRWVYYEGGSR
jgi:multiple sugar transport system permease protein